MSHVLRLYITTGIAIAGATLIMIPSLSPSAPNVQVRAAQLTHFDTADSPLGDGTAFVMGATGFPTPSQGWVDAIDSLYLQPRDFTGTAQALTTPESLYPLTGRFAQTFDASTAQGVQIVENTVHNQIASGGVNAADPIVITGYSQSSSVATLAMPQLAGQGVPSHDVHFLLVGDPSAPNGGYLERFDLPADTHPTLPSLGITFSGAGLPDFYPTDVYTMEYDGFADFPRYPINFLSDLNAYLGIIFNHLQYLGLTPDQIEDARQLPTSAADTLTNFYMIPSESLPLLDPLRLIPFVGNPLADLLQPDLRVLVNLGYGSITDGWSPGPADVATPMGFLPPLSVLEKVPEALNEGLAQGLNNAIQDLENPDNYQLVSPETLTAFLGPLLKSAQDEFLSGSSLTAIINNLVGSSGVITDFLDNIANGLTGLSFTHTGLPFIDVASTFLNTLPEIDVSIFEGQLAAGNLLAAIGDPVAFDLGIAPILLVGAVLGALL